jgi:hypothetical protein
MTRKPTKGDLVKLKSNYVTYWGKGFVENEILVVLYEIHSSDIEDREMFYLHSFLQNESGIIHLSGFSTFLYETEIEPVDYITYARKWKQSL